MTIKIGIVMDPIATIQPAKDTTFAIMLCAQQRGWQIHYMEPRNLWQDDGVVKAKCRHLKLIDDNQHWYDWQDEYTLELHQLDLVLMRKDPPVDSEFIYTTMLLEVAQQQGLLVFNAANALRDCNEKLFATHFPAFTPTHLVSRDMEQLHAFIQEHQDTVLKPLDGMGGRGIFRVRATSPNVDVILETSTNEGSRTVMLQKFIPAITEGDKRVHVIDGQAPPYGLIRIPKPGDFRGNLVAGANYHVEPLNNRDKEIVAGVAEELQRRGIIFAGLDIIGGYLTELNVTSPTGFREIHRVTNFDVAELLLDAIERKL